MLVTLRVLLRSKGQLVAAVFILVSRCGRQVYVAGFESIQSNGHASLENYTAGINGNMTLFLQYIQYDICLGVYHGAYAADT